METTIVRDLDLLTKMDDSEYIKTIFKKANLCLYHRKKTYYDYEYNITKLAKDIKNKKTLVIPGIEYSEGESNYYNNLDYLTDSLFTVPLISKVLKATRDYCYRNAFYYKFKSLYLEPILDAECSRMIRENINYMEEKPFIICVESAISRMLTDANRRDIVTESIWKSVYKDLEKCNVKFFYASLNEYGQVIENTGRVFGNFKFKDYFVLNDTSGFIESAMETMSPSSNNTSIVMKVMTYDHRNDITKLCKYFIKIFIIDFLKNEILSDFKKVYNDFNVDRMKNEIEISFIRNAKGISDYTARLDEIYDYFNKFGVEGHKCATKIFDFVDVLRESYLSTPEYLHLLKEAAANPNESLISDCFVKEFAAIGHIEALNKNYTTAEKSFAVDSEKLRSLFDQVIVQFKKLNKIVNDNYLIFMSENYFDYKTKDKITDRFSLISKLVEQMITCTLIDPNSSYHGKDPINDKFVWNVIKNCDVDFKYFKSRSNKERLNKFIDSEVEFIKNFINIYETFVGLMTEFDEIINDWKNIMERNIKYFYTYDPINELSHYLFFKKSLSGPEFIKFR